MAAHDSQALQSQPETAHHRGEPGLDEKQEKHADASKNTSDDLSKAPDGGLEAWLVAAGGFCIFFCCLGFSNSFGVLADYYLQHQLRGVSPSKIAWIGSLAIFLQFFSGMIGGPLFDRYGAKASPLFSVLAVLMEILIACAAGYPAGRRSLRRLDDAAQSLQGGTLMGFLQFPSMAAVSQYFDVNRAAAIGVAVSGSSIGGIIMPMALSKMLNGTNLGFGWSIRVIGFLILPFLAFPMFAIKARLPPRSRSFWLSAAFRDARLIVLTISMFFVFMGMFLPLFFIPTYATMRGMEPTLAGYLSAILNASSTFGRIIPGILADKVGKLNVYSTGALATAIVIFCMSEATTNAALIVYSIVFGFTSGTIISGASVAFTVCCPDVRDVGTYAGMGMALGALGGLMGPPLDGVMIEHYKGDFFQVAMFSGSVCLFGAFIAFANKWFTPQGLWGKS
ncbi:MFS monocarboxylate [Cordyceps militaris]|uniref:MFS monocarboxylate n=1 Tax=Cordyceps militaris TaxID=73501 RepID=A0A2H4ST92_CORMI|nr:MFS monocarboxylate [Cordyceps militaris]